MADAACEALRVIRDQAQYEFGEGRLELQLIIDACRDVARSTLEDIGGPTMAEPARRQLPNRRQQASIDFKHEEIAYTVSVGYRPDTGEAAEIFLHCHKTSSDLEAVARDAAIAISIALQFGAPFEVLRSAMTRNESEIACTVAGAALDTITSEGMLRIEVAAPPPT